MMDAAMTDSIRRVGNEMKSRAAKLSVMEWAMVKMVTILMMFHAAEPRLSAGTH